MSPAAVPVCRVDVPVRENAVTIHGESICLGTS